MGVTHGIGGHKLVALKDTQKLKSYRLQAIAVVNGAKRHGRRYQARGSFICPYYVNGIEYGVYQHGGQRQGTMRRADISSSENFHLASMHTVALMIIFVPYADMLARYR